MLDPHFVFLGAAIGLTGSVAYAIATIRGRIAPNRVTWILWAAAPLIGFFAQLDSGVGLPAVMTLCVGVGPLLVVIASFIGAASPPRVTVFDLLCAGISVLAIVLWLTLDQPVLAVVCSVLADAAGALPTYRKAWRQPRSETPLMYACFGANGTITLLTISTWSVEQWAFPVWITVLGASMVLLLALRRRALDRRSTRDQASTAGTSATAI